MTTGFALQFYTEGSTYDYVNTSGNDIGYLQVIPEPDQLYIASALIPAGGTGAIYGEGVFILPAKTEAFAFNDYVYWDATNAYVTKTANGNTLAGKVVEAKGQTGTTAKIDIDEDPITEIRARLYALENPAH